MSRDYIVKTLPVIAKFGGEVGLADRAMARLALAVCELSAKGELDEDDVSAAYETFNIARQPRLRDTR